MLKNTIAHVIMNEFFEKKNVENCAPNFEGWCNLFLKVLNKRSGYFKRVSDYMGFQMLGVALVTVGIWAWTEKGFFDNVAKMTDIPLDPVILIISIGIVMFLLSLTGCLGALRENICLLKFVSNPQVFFVFYALSQRDLKIP